MVLFERMIALAISGPRSKSELERRSAFCALLSSISVLSTIWIVVDALAVLHTVRSWGRR